MKRHIFLIALALLLSPFLTQCEGGLFNETEMKQKSEGDKSDSPRTAPLVDKVVDEALCEPMSGTAECAACDLLLFQDADFVFSFSPSAYNQSDAARQRLEETLKGHEERLKALFSDPWNDISTVWIAGVFKEDKGEEKGKVRVEDNARVVGMDKAKDALNLKLKDFKWNKLFGSDAPFKEFKKDEEKDEVVDWGEWAVIAKKDGDKKIPLLSGQLDWAKLKDLEVKESGSMGIGLEGLLEKDLEHIVIAITGTLPTDLDLKESLQQAFADDHVMIGESDTAGIFVVPVRSRMELWLAARAGDTIVIGTDVLVKGLMAAQAKNAEECALESDGEKLTINTKLLAGEASLAEISLRLDAEEALNAFFGKAVGGESPGARPEGPGARPDRPARPVPEGPGARPARPVPGAEGPGGGIPPRASRPDYPLPQDGLPSPSRPIPRGPAPRW